MEVTYCSDPGEGLEPALRSAAASASIEGVLLLATPDPAVRPSAVESVLAAVEVPVFGGVFPELIYDGERRTQGTLVVGLPSEPAVTTVPLDETASFGEALDASLPAAGYETAFVFVDAHASAIESFVDSLFRTYSVGLNFLGGGAGTLAADDEPCLFTDAGVVGDAAIVAALPESVGIGVNHGWQEVAGPFRVTEAEGSTLHALDGEPALSVPVALRADPGEPTQASDGCGDHPPDRGAGGTERVADRRRGRPERRWRDEGNVHKRAVRQQCAHIRHGDTDQQASTPSFGGVKVVVRRE